jgi:hypothetical protein
MKTVSVEFDLPLPNDFLVDHSFSDGKTQKYTYKGPDKIYLQINSEGKEVYGPLTEDDIMDGRPMPSDVVEWFEVDCEKNPLACQLRGPISNEQPDYTEEVPHPNSPDLEGFPRVSYSLPLKPEDVFDKLSVTVVDGEIKVRPFTVSEKLHGTDGVNLTWDDIRERRDQILAGTDGRINDDMPVEMIETWKNYRQVLRDFPATMQNAGVEPNIAYYMLPDEPYSKSPAE